MWTAEKQAAYMREYRAKHREGIKAMERAWKDKYRDDINRRARKRYHEDAEYRERVLERQRAARQRRQVQAPAPTQSAQLRLPTGGENADK